MDHAPPFETADSSAAREERRADVLRRIDEAADVLAETLLCMWRVKHRAEQRGVVWAPPELPR